MIAIIIGLAGAIGTGKSFTQLKQALQYAEDRQKQLVFNFEINVSELYKYALMPKHTDSLVQSFLFELKTLVSALLDISCRALKLPFRFKLPTVKPRLPWIAHLCKTGGIAQIPAPKYLEALLIPESVVCLDEAGILLNSREFAKTSKQLLADLAQSRKDGCDLFWAAQFDEQVDRQLRLLTQYWIHCDSIATYDKKLRRPKLFWKRIYWFRAADYQYWQQNARDRGSHFKARFAYGFKYEGGLLTPSDKQVFNIFNSFSRLDRARPGSVAKIVMRCRCVLPSDYYFNLLAADYHPSLDPFSRCYQPEYGWFRSRSRPSPLSDQPVEQRSSLIRRALGIARAKGVSAPFFKDMPEAEIHSFIRSNQ